MYSSKRLALSWIAILFLFVFWLSRTHNLLILPTFLDEASHITRAQWVWQGRPLYLLETGKAPYPVERTLLTSGALDAVMESHYRRGSRIETPPIFCGTM